MKQYAPAFERNREPIAAVLERALDDCHAVLEIGSGTGQHVVWFARRFPHIAWHPSDLSESVASIEAWSAEENLANVREPVVLDVMSGDWPDIAVDAIVTINTLHIMPWPATPALFRKAAELLPPGGVLLVYGPFRYRARSLESSNARFDEWLRSQDPERGLREFESVDDIAREHGFTLIEDVPMPANNRCAWWRKSTGRG